MSCFSSDMAVEARMFLLCFLLPRPREKEGISDSQTIKLLLLFFFLQKTKARSILDPEKHLKNWTKEKELIGCIFFKKALQWPPTAWDHLIKRRRRKKISYHYFHFTGGKIKICRYYCLSLRASWSIHKGHKNSRCWTKFMCESVYKKKCKREYSATGINMDSKEITSSEISIQIKIEIMT